jgi:hypothetical protein
MRGLSVGAPQRDVAIQTEPALVDVVVVNHIGFFVPSGIPTSIIH